MFGIETTRKVAEFTATGNVVNEIHPWWIINTAAGKVLIFSVRPQGRAPHRHDQRYTIRIHPAPVLIAKGQFNSAEELVKFLEEGGN